MAETVSVPMVDLKRGSHVHVTKCKKIEVAVNYGRGVDQRDWTLFALTNGLVKYERIGKDRTRVRIVPDAAPQA